MIAIFNKELNAYLSSLTGYITIGIFLVMMWLFVWVLPDTSVLDFGYARLDSLFSIAPWIFMFLVPAVTMRMFSEEKKTGTIELLVTRPLTEWQIVLGKYLASVVLIIFALLPTLVYYVSIYYLGATVGNVDGGAIFGSYLGLLFLASGMVAVGLLASSITDNQIVAFILAVTISFLLYNGFDLLSTLPLFNKIAYTLTRFSIDEHYQSMSRGVIDSRDVIYFVSLIGIFLLLTKTRLDSRKW